MTSKTISFLLAAAFLPLGSLFAQEAEFHCGANELDRMGALINGHPERLQEIAQARADLEHFTAQWAEQGSRDDNTYIIPVVFHIIHNNGLENISDAQVHDAIRVMNEDFNKLTPDWSEVQPEFLGLVADMEVTFKLAQLDPAGNCTNGITRTVSTLTNEGNQDMKNLINWPRNRYLNIWVAANAGGAAGYSMYPSSVSGPWGAAADGIVVLSSYVGSIGTSNLSRSHTLSHEAGHWLNLMHCWGDSNDPGLASNCQSDDGVGDTPNTKGWTSCNLRGASCGSAVDNVENFMEYSYCSKMFTNGQKVRLHAALNSTTAGRNNLWSATNLALTGLSTAPEICSVQFNSSSRIICAGEAVTFTDASYNGVNQWDWTFEGGNPAMSDSASATVTYATPGLYNVALNVGNGLESDGVTQEEYIKVLPATGSPLSYSEGFEGMNDLANSDWTALDLNNDGTFMVSSAAAYSGSNGLKLTNSSTMAGRTDELLSTTIDNTVDAPAVINFRYAFAKRNSSNNDALRVYASRDCGETWSLRRTLIGDNLATAPVSGGSFTPNGPGQWGFNELAPISGLFEVTNLRIKFVFDSDGGNNLWLDDININGASVGIGELADGAAALSIVPNPAKDRMELGAWLQGPGAVKVELMDLLGRPVQLVDQGVRPSGAAKWDVDLNGLSAGMYIVRVEQEGRVQVARFAKE